MALLLDLEGLGAVGKSLKEPYWDEAAQDYRDPVSGRLWGPNKDWSGYKEPDLQEALAQLPASEPFTGAANPTANPFGVGYEPEPYQPQNDRGNIGSRIGASLGRMFDPSIAAAEPMTEWNSPFSEGPGGALSTPFDPVVPSRMRYPEESAQTMQGEEMPFEPYLVSDFPATPTPLRRGISTAGRLLDQYVAKPLDWYSETGLASIKAGPFVGMAGPPGTGYNEPGDVIRRQQEGAEQAQGYIRDPASAVEAFRERPWYEQLGLGGLIDPTAPLPVVGFGPDILRAGKAVPRGLSTVGRVGAREVGMAADVPATRAGRALAGEMGGGSLPSFGKPSGISGELPGIAGFGVDGSRVTVMGNVPGQPRMVRIIDEDGVEQVVTRSSIRKKYLPPPVEAAPAPSPSPTGALPPRGGPPTGPPKPPGGLPEPRMPSRQAAFGTTFDIPEGAIVRTTPEGRRPPVGRGNTVIQPETPTWRMPDPDRMTGATEAQRIAAKDFNNIYLKGEETLRISGVPQQEITSARGEMARRLGAAKQAAEKNGLIGKEQSDFIRQTALERGGLRETITEMPETVGPEVDWMFDVVGKAYPDRGFDWIQADTALRDSLGGLGVQPRQRDILEAIFGDGWEDAERAIGRLARAKHEATTMPMDLGEGLSRPGQPPLIGETGMATVPRSGPDWKQFENRGSTVGPAPMFPEGLPVRAPGVPDVPGRPNLSLADEALSGAEPVSGAHVAAAIQGRRMPNIPKAALSVVTELLYLPKAAKLGFDFAYMMLQGGPLGRRFPDVWAKSAARSVRALGTRDSYGRVMKLLDNSANARVKREAGLFQTHLAGGKLSAKEETLMSNLVGHIPILGNIERGMTAFLDTQRNLAFDKLWDGLGPLEQTSERAKAIAKLVNYASQRGPAIVDQGALVPIVTNALTSQRRLTSFAALPAQLASKDPMIRREALKILALTWAGNALVFELGNRAGVWKVELDPRADRFGDLQLGPYHIDVWHGWRTPIRFVAQELTGQRKTEAGDIRDVNRIGAATQFGRGRLSPTAAEAVTQYTGEDFAGRKVNQDLPNSVWRLLGPLAAEDWNATRKALGDGWAAGLIPLSMSGAATGAYYTTGQLRDQEAKARGWGNYSQLEEWQQKQVNESERLTKQFGKYAPSETDKIREKYQDKQVALDDELASGAKTPQQWKGQRKILLAEQRGEYNQATKGFPPKAEKDKTPVDRYYEFIDKEATSASGEVDWDKVDRYVAGLSGDDSGYIARNTGLGGTDTEKRYRAETKVVADSGYFDLRDKAWQSLREKHPAELGNIPDFYEWKKQEIADLTQQGIDYGYAPEIAAEKAAAKVEGYKLTTAFNEHYRTEFRHNWVVDNPQIALRAVSWDFLDPDKAEEDFLGGVK